MLYKNKLMILSLMSIIFIVSCSNDMKVESSAENADGGTYDEFVESLESTDGETYWNLWLVLVAQILMLKIHQDDNWQKLVTAESLFGVWGYVPAADTNAFGDTLWWELNWNSKEEADAEWRCMVSK